MRDSGCGCAPVIENTDNPTLVGVVTERDVCCDVAAEDRRASELRVAEIMRPASACCGAEAPVDEARRKLHEHRRTSLPVGQGVDLLRHRQCSRSGDGVARSQQPVHPFVQRQTSVNYGPAGDLR